MKSLTKKALRRSTKKSLRRSTKKSLRRSTKKSSRRIMKGGMDDEDESDEDETYEDETYEDETDEQICLRKGQNTGLNKKICMGAINILREQNPDNQNFDDDLDLFMDMWKNHIETKFEEIKEKLFEEDENREEILNDLDGIRTFDDISDAYDRLGLTDWDPEMFGETEDDGQELIDDWIKQIEETKFGLK